MNNKFWYVRDKTDGRVWNGMYFTTKDSAPKLYLSPRRMKYQFERGKIKEWTEAGLLVPELVEVDLFEVAKTPTGV